MLDRDLDQLSLRSAHAPPRALAAGGGTRHYCHMKYLHTMVRVTDIDASLKFYRDALGLRELRRMENDKGRFTLVFLAAPGDESAQIELTWNWDPEPTLAGAISATSPTRWTTSTRPAAA